MLGDNYDRKCSTLTHICNMCLCLLISLVRFCLSQNKQNIKNTNTTHCGFNQSNPHMLCVLVVCRAYVVLLAVIWMKSARQTNGDVYRSVCLCIVCALAKDELQHERKHTGITFWVGGFPRIPAKFVFTFWARFGRKHCAQERTDKSTALRLGNYYSARHTAEFG